MSLKEKVMDKMMDKQFKNMSTDDKKAMMESMMEKFFSGMTDEEKKDMMSGMMPKMMGQMMGDNPMMGMMSMMMGRKKGGAESDDEGSKKPWDMCGEMMSGIKETANNSRFATPELRGLFDEWCQQIETEMLENIKDEKKIETKDLAEKFNLSEESIKYILGKLASKNLIDYKVV